MQPRRGPTREMSSVRRKTKIFLQLVGSFFEAVAVPTRLAELIGGARQLQVQLQIFIRDNGKKAPVKVCD